MRYLNGEWDRGAERDHHFPLLSSHFFLLTETFHRRKPSETICPARVAVMLALSPAQSSATANKTAAAVCVRVCQIRVSLPAREVLGFSRMNELTFADT